MNQEPDLLPAEREAPPRRPVVSHRAVAGWTLLGLSALAAAAVGTAALLPVAEQVPARTYVAGVPVGGLDGEAAGARVEGPVAAKVATGVRLEVGDDAVTILPAEFGVRLDAAATRRKLLARAPDNLLEKIVDRVSDRGSTSRRDVDPVITIDVRTARKVMAARLQPFQRTARDASMELPDPSPVLSDKGDTSFTARAANPTVVPARDGQEVDVIGAVSALRQAVGRQRTEIRPAVTVTRPAVTTEAVSKVDQLIGTFTTLHPCCAPRVTNIQRIAELVDGRVIRPGTTFSLNQASGRRTAENGFVSAPAIADGELVDQFGGGVSQFSTTLFNAAWFAGLDVVKHQPHSKYISRYPPGREATLDFDTIDQVIRNDTDAPVVIRTATTGTSVTVALYGHTGEREVVSTTGPRTPRAGGGFSVDVERTVTDDGTEVDRDSLSWTYTGLD